MRRKSRLERFENLMEKLIEKNKDVPIIVEGRKDRESLRELGVRGEIFSIYVGKNLAEFSEIFYGTYTHIVLMMDWDRGGRTLQKKLLVYFESLGIDVDSYFWDEFVKIGGKDVNTVEALPRFYERLKSEVE